MPRGKRPLPRPRVAFSRLCRPCRIGCTKAAGGRSSTASIPHLKLTQIGDELDLEKLELFAVEGRNLYVQSERQREVLQAIEPAPCCEVTTHVGATSGPEAPEAVTGR